MEKITASQKKILIAAFVILLVSLAFWLFAYLPNRSRVAAIKSELLQVESQLQKIQAAVGALESPEESLRLLLKRQQQLSDKFPLQEEQSLRELSRLARGLDIELVSIQPQPKVIFLDANREEIEIEGRVCQTVFVSMELKCFYKDLVKYIAALQEVLPALVTIERLRVKKRDPETSRLNIVLEINLYLLS